jgi:hypothetical protein
VFLEDGYCGAAAIELEPEGGCLTYTRVDEAEDKNTEEWEEEEFDEEGDEEGEDFYEEDEDEELWDDDEEDY